MNRFVQFRKEKRRPMGPIAVSQFINRLVRFAEDGYDPALLIATAIDNDWQTVHPRDDCKRLRAVAGSDVRPKCSCGATATANLRNVWYCGLHLPKR